MATVGQLAAPKRLAEACSGWTLHPLYPAGNGSLRASQDSLYLQNSFATVSEGGYRHMSSQLPLSSSKRETYAREAIPRNSASGSANNGIDVDGYRSKFEALLYCGKSIPEENIERPTGLPTKALPVGNKPKCLLCEAKGAVECATCAGTGLYVDAVLESQGVIVRVRCLGCGGSGNTMCTKCWGRGHV